MGAIAIGIINAVSTLGSKFIADKDKQTEFAFMTQELAFKTMETLLTAKTYPWVDGLVKLLYTLQIFIRPAIGGAMTVFGAYMHYKGTPMDGVAQTIFDGAFPAWGVSRHVEKQNKAKKKDIWDDYGD